MAKRHKWQEVSRKRSMIHNTVSRCENCGLERAQYMDFGHYRTAFRTDSGKWTESKTPECSAEDLALMMVKERKMTKITVNGKEHDHEGETIDYDDIATLVAFEERWQPPIPLLSITYSWDGEGDTKREGILSPKDRPIMAAEEMRFSAHHTGNA